MNCKAFCISFFEMIFLLLTVNCSQALAKPYVTTHEATYLGGAVNLHIEWQSPNPVTTVKISMGSKEQNLKVDPFENRRNPFGYEGEVNVTIRLDSAPNQPFNYVIQLEDELRMKSALVTGKVKISSSQQAQFPQFPQQQGMQIQIQQNVPQPTFSVPQQPGLSPGTAPGAQQVGAITVIIAPENAVKSGAMWRVGNGPWKKSRETISGLSKGLHAIEYQDISNWIKPGNFNVMVEGGQTVTIDGVYTNK